jgi:hypothetical protein
VILLNENEFYRVSQMSAQKKVKVGLKLEPMAGEERGGCSHRTQNRSVTAKSYLLTF